MAMQKIYYAKWLKAPTCFGEQCPIFLKDFSAPNIQKAYLEVSALGVYEAQLNGKRVGDFFLAPGWTNDKARVQFQRYDITDMLQAENRLEIWLGQGWRFMSGGIISGTYLTQYDSALIAAIHLIFSDGSEQVITTDEHWRVKKSPVLMSHFYHGERYQAGWQDETLYEPVYLLHVSRTVLIEQEGEKVTEYQMLPVQKIIRTPKGETVLDFGQNLTGRIEMDVQAAAGQTVKLLFGEILDKDGNFYNKNYRTAKNCVEYISDGTAQTYKPYFFFTGFRYVKVENWNGEVRPEQFRAYAVSSELKQRGNFRCSDERLNRLFLNGIWGQRDNFVDVPTDCPQRDERLGWTGDILASYPCAALNFDMQRFIAKWMRDVASEQWENGDVVPFSPFRGYIAEYNMAVAARVGGPAWSDVMVLIPWMSYVAYRDVALLEELFPNMKKYTDRRIQDWKEEHIYVGVGDWLAEDREGNDDLEWMKLNCDTAVEYTGHTDKGLISLAYLYEVLKRFVRICQLLGEDETYYADQLAQLRRDFRRRYLKGGRLTVNTQTACVLALQFGLCDSGDDVAQQLVELIRKVGYMNSGFLGAAFVLPVLCDNGYAELAYDLLLREEHPSWLYPLTKGATTFWEQWSSILPDGTLCQEEFASHNHHGLSSVCEFLYSRIAGIRADESNPGHRHVFLRPYLDSRLSFAEATLETKQGLIKAGWEITEDESVYRVTLPEGTTATMLWDGVTRQLEAGEYEFRKVVK